MKAKQSIPSGSSWIAQKKSGLMLPSSQPNTFRVYAITMTKVFNLILFKSEISSFVASKRQMIDINYSPPGRVPSLSLKLLDQALSSL